MRHILNVFTGSMLLLLCITACQKVEDLPYYDKGEKVTLSASSNEVSPGPADSLNNVITFSWTTPNYATDTTNYKFIIEIDSTDRNFAKAVTKTVTGQLNGSLTGKELNAILLNYGFELGEAYELDVRVLSSYVNNNERYHSNTVKISVTPYNDPSVLESTENNVTLELANAAQNVLTFSWSPSFNGYSGNVTYKLQYDSVGKNFANLDEIDLGVNVYSQQMTQTQINESSMNSGIPAGNLGTVEYRIKATTAQGAVSYSAPFSVTIQSYVPILRFYLPGSYQASAGYGNDWTPETAPELIRDTRPDVLNKMYYIYIYLPANTSFKVTQGRSWDINYGGSGGNLVQNSPDNLNVSAAGYYRITIDRSTMKYDIKEGRMGFVGGGTGADWTPANVFPTYAMGLASTNLFVGLTNLTTSGEWKMIDNDVWNGALSVSETRSYGASGGSGSTVSINTSTNFPAVTTAGRYRVMWDGRNPDNVKYEMSPATEMRLVGNGIDVVGVGDWDPPSSPQMTYNGNGIWTITIALKANMDIKFLAGNAWGAFDYEDDSGESQATGIDRKIRWDGDKNFKTPAVAGTYTVTLNENTQRAKIE